ncbi:hypothetical protein QNI23_017155 (plasmid) [Bermanella sp. WJH001]|uniref:hypothetical protein n=1 Tax=Bermanella sp. WJH001 TaxID=3048005 RepID=UPI0024BDE5CB|nr:hypothetical protein [Bermanella sp. WJH001]MDJ1539479.1 hypothetical protein [Bermanella sp. WJH001]
MSVDSWQPITPPNQINDEQLARLLNLNQGQAQEYDLTSDLDWIQPLAQVDAKIWQQLAPKLTFDQIQQLIEIFTLAEQQGSWSLGEKSSVIPLFKILKKAKGVDRELVKWVKAHTDNKFLPFGPLL